MSGKVVKRRVSLGAMVAAAGLLMAGCGASVDTIAGPTASGPAVAGQATENSFSGSRFSFSGHGGTSQKAQDSILQDFADTVGAQYAPDGPPDLAKIQAQVDAGSVTWDLVVLSDTVAANPDYCGQLVEKIDWTKVDASKLPDIAPSTDCGVPINANGWSFAYNKDAFAGAADMTWERFFDTEKYPGKRAIYAGTPQNQLEVGLLGDGVAASDLYPLDVERSLAKFDSVKDDLVFYNTGSESQQMMDSNEVVACLCWSGRVFTIIENGGNWTLSTEAPPQLRIDYVGIPKGSKNVDLAHAAINYFIGAEQQRQWQEDTAYPSMNRDVEVQLSEAAEQVNVLDPKFNANRIDLDYWVQNLSPLMDRWTTWITE